MPRECPFVGFSVRFCPLHEALVAGLELRANARALQKFRRSQHGGPNGIRSTDVFPVIPFVGLAKAA